MYEAHFGLTGPPFQLNPDPAFYYDSRGHSSALAYLKFGAHQGEGFIVVTGEIGAGKTTLVKTLLGSLDPDRLVAAQIVSTQLESGDLLRTILTAFGIPPTGATKAHLLSTMEGFLTAVAAKGRRALLIVDEAQNLDRGAVEELRMLSNFQLGNQGLLQSFLVGQPELRVLLQSKSMEQLRQRVIASCHLGPLDRGETRAYIEHRLHHVGWVGNPGFDDGAHERIHHWTGGIPRRINRLCNRLLLGAFLADQSSISAGSVDRTAIDLGAEIGEERLPAGSVVGPVGVAAQGAAEPADAGPPPVEVLSRGPAKPAEPLLCLVDGLADYLKAGALAQQFGDQPSLPPVIAVNIGESAALEIGTEALARLALPAVDIHLNLGDSSGAAGAAQALKRFDAILDEYAPAGVLAMGSGNAVLACALLAHKRGIAVLRNSAGRRRAWASASDLTNAGLLDQFADFLYTDNLATHYALYKVGISSGRVQCVGDLASNVAYLARSSAPDPTVVLARFGLSGQQFGSDKGFAFVTKRFRPLQTSAAQVLETVSMIATVRAELPVLWAVDGGTLLELKANGAEAQLVDAGVSVLAEPGYLDCIALLGLARCVVAGPEATLVDEARAIGIPSLVIDPGLVVLVGAAEAASSGVAHGPHQLRKIVHDIVAGESVRADSPEYWDGGAGLRIATHLGHWLRNHNRAQARLRRSTAPAGQRIPAR